MSFVYDPSDYELGRLIFTYHDTVWVHVVRRASFWFFVLGHSVFWVVVKFEFMKHMPFQEFEALHKWIGIEPKDLSMITALTTFFQVFYTSQSYSRYFEVNSRVMVLFERAHQYAFGFKVHVHIDNVRYLWSSLRWLRMSLLFFFADLRRIEIQEEHFDNFVGLGHLTPEESEYLRRIAPAHRNILLLDWMLRATSIALKDHNTNRKDVVRMCLDFQAAQKSVLEITRMPVPFQYFHFLHLMVFFTLSLWAYVLGLQESVMCPIMYFCACFIFIGMLELAKLFADPFGCDEVDFPMDVWFEKFMENQLASINADYPGGEAGLQAMVKTALPPAFQPESLARCVREPLQG